MSATLRSAMHCRAIWAVLICPLVHGQEFDVASIRPAAGAVNGTYTVGRHGGPGTNDPGRITWMNITLMTLLSQAYDVKPNQILGGPAWLDRDRFEVLGKLPAGATRDSIKPMLRNLLAARFQLQAHRETKELPVYALVVGKGGPKMRESGTDSPPSLPSSGPFTSRPDGCYDLALMRSRPGELFSVANGNACLTMSGRTIAALADTLSNQLDRPVVDATGLEAKYEFHLRYDAMSAAKGIAIMTGSLPNGPDITPDPDRAPSIFVAVQEQLGLKLEARKSPVGVLVIDRIERVPTEN